MISWELHRGDTRDGQRDGCLRGPHQLRHQERRITDTGGSGFWVGGYMSQVRE
jgi:hypothetical protein